MAAGENNFSGFSAGDSEISTKLWHRRVLALESDVEKLMERFRAMEESQISQIKELKGLRAKNIGLRNQYIALEIEIKECSKKVEGRAIKRKARCMEKAPRRR